jgi:aryl-alcohol dehydrogenase
VEALAHLGTCGIIGGAPAGTELRLPYSGVLVGGRTVRGIVQGDSVPDLFIPTLIELYRNGRLPLERLVAFYPFEQINEAARASEQGEVVKPVLRIGPQQ